jgi:hypothetical protein
MNSRKKTPDSIDSSSSLKTSNESGSSEGFRRQIICYRCQKKGYIARNYSNKRTNGQTNESAQVVREHDVALIGLDTGIVLSSEKTEDIPNHLWIADSGASFHVARNDICMFDTTYSNNFIVVGGGTRLPILKTGKLRISFKRRDGKFREAVLQDVNHVPEMKMTLFSFNKGIYAGGRLFSDGRKMIIKK